MDTRSAGHWVLFKAGWLHRDVSALNIMAIEPENRSAVQEYVQSVSFGTEQSANL
jgi:hypothetical protein